MPCVMSLCLGHGHGGTWCRFAPHNGLLECSHGCLLLVDGTHHVLYLYALGITIVLHGLGLRNTVDTWAVAMGV
jgi:hypothetical protein